MIDVGLGRGAGRILADHEGNRSMSVDMIAAVLRIVFENEDSGVIPVETVRDGVDHAAQG